MHYFNEKPIKNRILDLEMKIFQEIKNYILKRGHSPSVRELTKIAGIPSTATTYAYMVRLQKKGMIDWEPKECRTLKIIEDE